VKYNFIDNLKNKKLSIQLICKTINICRSSYYSWKTRPVSQQSIANEKLTEKIKLIHNKSKETYGLPRIKAALKNNGENCGKSRVEKLMKKENIFGIGKKKFKVNTTDSKHSLPIAKRIFKTEDKSTFPVGPNKVWVGDITYIPTKEGWLFLAIYLDIFNRKVVGYAMDDNMKTNLILKALNMGIVNEVPKHGELISHTDRGSQYASGDCRNRLNLLGITASMSRTGNCYDNAFAETFFHTLKVELVHREVFQTREDAKQKIFNYIETWYNKQRLHSSLGFMSPVQYEEQYKLLSA
jgi:putative transposase